MKEEVINLSHLSFGYSTQLILDDVDLSIQRGEFIGIIGPNGGGKTTLLKLLMGFLKPLHGSCHLFNLPPKDARTKIGYVPQTLQFDKHFPITVMELVLGGRLSKSSFFGPYNAQDKKKALEALDCVGLSAYTQRAFGTLSGGEAQRALIARALASEPELLLLDEPTASVDKPAEEEIHALLGRLKGSLTMLMVTHDLTTILKQVDRIICVQKKISNMDPKYVCEHHAFGLYHSDQGKD
ncbi:MAG: ABC transporter ATP-binding protein [Parachlamydiales bacterium]|nr:ABC transporter ATP-binding protein [Parachlamydiales bacterium]